MLGVGNGGLYFAFHYGIELPKSLWPFLAYAAYEAYSRLAFDSGNHENSTKNMPPAIAHGLEVIHAIHGGFALHWKFIAGKVAAIQGEIKQLQPVAHPQ